MKLKRFTAQLAAAGLVALPLMANAAGLGKLTVGSALGQPLSAEIELFAADKAELDSLSAALASDQAFRDARVEFAPVLSSLRFAVERKADGKAVLKVTSSRPVTDPFLDMLVELSWASGRLVREYTMLLDPPGMTVPQAVPPVVTAPDRQASEPAQASGTQATPVPTPAPVARTARPAKPEPEAKPKAAPAPQSMPTTVHVKHGDSLSKIAERVRPEGVSLEQTLLGLYRDNASAFGGNMNRLKAGRTLNIPEAGTLSAISQQEAVREIKLQAEDWRAYRQKLAAAAPTLPEAASTPGQSSRGKIAPKVEDRAKPAAESQQDVLKLSPTAGKSADEARALQEKLRVQEEDAIARQKALDESDQRVAALEKQIQDMQKLVEMKEKAPAKEAGPEVPVEPEAPPAPKVEIEPAPPRAPAVATPAAPEPAQSWAAPLFANPLYWGGGLVAVALGGLLWWMMAGGRRRRAKNTSTAALDDSIMSGGDMRPNTVAGAASGGSVNTGDTSFLTDFSQAGLGTIDTHDVDPIAEAEVYMAYGRDAQAEEILKEAIGKNPDRHEIRVKLLEIYAARRNTSAYESVTGELLAALGDKDHPLWEKACEMGRSIDPTNPLYGGKAAANENVSNEAAATVAATAAIAGGAMVMADAAGEANAPAPVASEPEPQPDPVTASTPLEFESAGHVLNFDAQTEAATVVDAAVPDTQGLDFELPELDLPPADDDLKLDLGLQEDNGPDSQFDFSGLDLDLGESAGGDLELDEVGTKLDLARAYVEMGDKEGAREILNEVLAEGSERQKADAQDILAALG